MDQPTQLPARRVAPDTHVLPGWLPLPGLGVISMNSFLIKGARPVLVDTGAAPMQEGLISELSALIDLEDLAWIWLTHTDPDHVGGLLSILERAPNARVVTTFLGVGKLGLLGMPIPQERFWLLNPGGSLDVGDRTLVALRPPVYDAPETMGLFDTRTRALVVADAFGTLVEAPVDSAEAVSDEALAQGMLTWAGIDVPWLETVDRVAFGRKLDDLSRLEASVVLGAHVAPATDLSRLSGTLERAVGQAPLLLPDQESMAAQNVA